MKTYEVVVIGAGPGGYQSALELADAGKQVLLIDRSKERIGGTCLNEGCIPTKNYLQSAEFISKISYFRECGLSLDFNGFNLEQLREKTISLKNEIRTGVLWMLEQAKVELLYGSAAFVDANTLEVSGEQIAFEKCVIATGSKTRELSSLLLDGTRIISSREVFELKEMPKRVAIVGVGPIGCEFATFFNAFGVEVTLIGRGEQLLSGEDEDVSKAILRAFKKQNMRVMTSTLISKYEINENEVELFIEEQEIIKCDLVIVAIGRVPYTKELSLENAGVKQDENGFIEINPFFVTSQSHIYAVGDCISTPAFAHTAYAEAKIAARNIVNSGDEKNEHINPSTIFTHPSIASCGLNERAAKEQGREVEVKKTFFKVNSKAKIHGDDSGFAKVIVCAKSGEILGAVIIGVEATEIIHELVLAVERKVTYKELKGIIHAHPTVAEIISYL